MSEVSEFSVNQTTLSEKPFSLTPQTFHIKSLPQTHCTLNSGNNHSQSPTTFKCTQCAEHLSNLTQIKKRQIFLEYEIEKLKQELQKMKRQNQHLKQLQYNYHAQNIAKYNPMMYFKEDLQAELYEAKYLLELHTLARSQDNLNHSKILVGKQSQRERQALESLAKPVDLKVKCEQLLLENIKLQQKNMIKDKIIQDRVLFPLYHYDQRILTLRKAVEYWYRQAEQESSKLSQVLIQVKKYQKELKRQAKTMIQQEKIHWQNQFKKVLSHLNEDTLKSIILTSSDPLKNSQNQIEQKRISSKSYNQNNILIEEDHTIFSLCQKINDKSVDHAKVTKRNSLKNPHILCESCLNSSINGKKKSKNCSTVNKKQNKSSNKTGKGSAKNEGKIDGFSIDRKSQQMTKKTIKVKNFVQANNSSILGKNFQNIEIKVKPRQKCEVNCKKSKNTQGKVSLHEFSCQRCADRIM